MLAMASHVFLQLVLWIHRPETLSYASYIYILFPLNFWIEKSCQFDEHCGFELLRESCLESCNSPVRSNFHECELRMRNNIARYDALFAEFETAETKNSTFDMTRDRRGCLCAVIALCWCFWMIKTSTAAGMYVFSCSICYQAYIIILAGFYVNL